LRASEKIIVNPLSAEPLFVGRTRGPNQTKQIGNAKYAIKILTIWGGEETVAIARKKDKWPTTVYHSFYAKAHTNPLHCPGSAILCGKKEVFIGG